MLPQSKSSSMLSSSTSSKVAAVEVIFAEARAFLASSGRGVAASFSL